MQFESRFALFQRVTIDGDVSIVGTVTALCFRGTRQTVAEVSWFHNGDAKTGWFEEERLALEGARDRPAGMTACSMGLVQPWPRP
ncbi:hypothetical protein [Rhodoplanes roseus]|uniref:Uncharacterized protein n=1 Tax=Rhodoplanes roseus TaxID=29409 RepID=A0A327L4N7_9BRAD|nr:hypothetical protein [Rhodoplanes roseus]RAI42648.1 hypothetical protein CH341_18485 [Rhodoplanes roseus]